MPHEAEVAELSALAQRLGPDKIGIRQISIVDHIGMTAHGSELQHTAGAQYFLIDALVTFKVEFIPGIILVPGISPPVSGALPEPKGNDLFHQRKEKSLLCQFLHAGGVKDPIHFIYGILWMWIMLIF